MARKAKRSSGRDRQTRDAQSPSKKLKGESGWSAIPYLPLDVIISILSRLPAKALMRFQIVCKLWYCLIFHPWFIELHLRRTLRDQKPGYLMKANNRLLRTNNQNIRPVYFLENKEDAAYPNKLVEVFQPSQMVADNYSIVDSCHGLVCFSDYYHTVSIYNPTTNDLIYLPRTSTRILELAFTYDPPSKKYKVFGIFPNYTPTGYHDISEYEVFTLGSTSWRQKGFLPYFPNETRHFQCNGGLHWMFGHETNPHMLLSIHISKEVSRTYPIPHARDGSFSPFLIQYEGGLGICMMGAKQMEIWGLTRTETKILWEKRLEFTLPTWIARARVPMKVFPMLSRRDNDVILSRGRTKLVFFDLKTKISKNINTSRLGNWSDLRIVEHTETLAACGSRSVKKWPEMTNYVANSFPADMENGEGISRIRMVGASTAAGGT